MRYCDQEQCTLTCIVKKNGFSSDYKLFWWIRANECNTYYWYVRILLLFPAVFEREIIANWQQNAGIQLLPDHFS